MSGNYNVMASDGSHPKGNSDNNKQLVDSGPQESFITIAQTYWQSNITDSTSSKCYNRNHIIRPETRKI